MPAFYDTAIPVKCFDTTEKKLLGIYRTRAEAAKLYKVTYKKISYSIKNRGKTRGNLAFRNATEVELKQWQTDNPVKAKGRI